MSAQPTESPSSPLKLQGGDFYWNRPTETVGTKSLDINYPLDSKFVEAILATAATYNVVPVYDTLEQGNIVPVEYSGYKTFDEVLESAQFSGDINAMVTAYPLVGGLLKAIAKAAGIEESATLETIIENDNFIKLAGRVLMDSNQTDTQFVILADPEQMALAA